MSLHSEFHKNIKQRQGKLTVSSYVEEALNDFFSVKEMNLEFLDRVKKENKFMDIYKVWAVLFSTPKILLPQANKDITDCQKDPINFVNSSQFKGIGCDAPTIEELELMRCNFKIINERAKLFEKNIFFRQGAAAFFSYFRVAHLWHHPIKKDETWERDSPEDAYQNMMFALEFIKLLMEAYPDKQQENFDIYFSSISENEMFQSYHSAEKIDLIRKEGEQYIFDNKAYEMLKKDILSLLPLNNQKSELDQAVLKRIKSEAERLGYHFPSISDATSNYRSGSPTTFSEQHAVSNQESLFALTDLQRSTLEGFVGFKK